MKRVSSIMKFVVRASEESRSHQLKSEGIVYLTATITNEQIASNKRAKPQVGVLDAITTAAQPSRLLRRGKASADACAPVKTANSLA
jgi:hypothetical protein